MPFHLAGGKAINMARMFISYAHADEKLQKSIETHLSALKRRDLIEVWHDRRLTAGEHVDDRIGEELARADLVMLLVSASFINSNYCYSKEMEHALQRHRSGECRVIPVIIRPCAWTDTPLGELLAVPTDGKAVTLWKNSDQAFTNVVAAVERALLDHKERDLRRLGRTAFPNDLARTQPHASTAGTLPQKEGQKSIYYLKCPASEEEYEYTWKMTSGSFTTDLIDMEADRRAFRRNPYPIVVLLDEYRQVQGCVDLYHMKDDDLDRFLNDSTETEVLDPDLLLGYQDARRAKRAYTATLLVSPSRHGGIDRRAAMLVYGMMEYLLRHQFAGTETFEIFSIGTTHDGDEMLWHLGFKFVRNVQMETPGDIRRLFSKKVTRAEVRREQPKFSARYGLDKVSLRLEFSPPPA